MPFIRSAFCPALCLAIASCGGLYHQATEKRPPGTNRFSTAGGVGTVIARGTTLSVIRQPVSTTLLGFSVIWQRPRELITGTLPATPDLMAPPQQAPGTPGFERLLDEAGMPAPEMGKATWLVDGKRYYPELQRQINAAKKSIDVQVYIFDSDDIAVRHADMLKKRSHEVPVRLVFDDLGSFTACKSPPETPFPSGFRQPSSMAEYFRQDSRVSVRRSLNPWLVCDHSKLQVFDGRVALMGCMNIGREYYSEWHDLMFRIEGPVVTRLQEDFNRSWHHAGPAGIFSLARKEPAAVVPAVPGSYAMRVLRTDPAARRAEIRKATLLAIRAARKRVWVENPYVANDDVTEELEAAARRGVDVRLVFPSKNDSTIMDISNKAFATQLVKAGGKAYAYPGMTHMKVMVCDDWAIVGSANLDTLSMRINRELDVSFKDKRAVASLVDAVFTPDFSKAKRWKPDAPALSAPLAEAVADQL
jgi:cardiolipin synthase